MLSMSVEWKRIFSLVCQPCKTNIFQLYCTWHIIPWPRRSHGGKEKEEGTFFEKDVPILYSQSREAELLFFFFHSLLSLPAGTGSALCSFVAIAHFVYQHWIRAEVWMGINALFFAYRKIRHYVSISRLCNDNNKVSKNDDMLTLVWALNTAE